MRTQRKLTMHMVGILTRLYNNTTPKYTRTDTFVRSALISLAERGLITIGVHVALTPKGRECAKLCIDNPTYQERGYICPPLEHTCDGCGKSRSDVRSCGRDANGDPDAPDLCFFCRREKCV